MFLGSRTVETTRALALEWARQNVRINLLESGWMAEEGSPALADDEFATNLLKYLPYKRLVQPEELAGALLYLASPASGFVTGEAIAIDRTHTPCRDRRGRQELAAPQASR